MLENLLRGDYGLAPTNLTAVALGGLLAFLGGQLVAWVYMVTHERASYSRAFVVSLVMLPVIVALVMIVLANNLVTAFGLMAVFAIVRFRNILRDTLDTAYLLGVIVLGMACGMQKFTTAVLGTLMIAGLLLYLWATGFGRRHRYDLVLHLRWLRPVPELAAVRGVLGRHSRAVLCAEQRHAPGAPGLDVSFRLRLRDPERAHELVAELRALAGVDGLSSAAVAEESEV